MKSIPLKSLLLGLCAATLCGCSTVSEQYKEYDNGRKYLKDDKYQDAPLVVPQKFSRNKIEDYYPVPPSQQETRVSTNEPSLTPPSNSIKDEKVT
ncbi:MAG: hypothetical protein M3R00_07745 [Pseudomonadota bacterium]|nr:hypothetical protein [Pseudomonadota bacterium]